LLCFKNGQDERVIEGNCEVVDVGGVVAVAEVEIVCPEERQILCVDLPVAAEMDVVEMDVEETLL